MKKYITLALAISSFTAMATDKTLDCDNALSTLEINQCALIELELAQTELTQYLEASLEHNAFDSELIESITIAQKDWQVYMQSHCDSVYTKWREGTIRGVMAVACKTKLTKQRTHEVWSNFLTYMDSTPPVLSEPSK
ncbi:lysozyme inhibitor LprI family protein [Alkalimonas collagenimarina]|uniref:Lysozyme inhibitor LprI family protein n=1 Tax=Alkalimonas collagenimarina TaxID=400390 RepID=A0ABT9GV61_9GAMM|nr:lysozyme inhibitor LprI family protein [Alkalimonas collagenimarina]MDP4534774.1 lysozyme inhibitor LprI family protein [Alkalimonas collagenimarina]